MQEEVIKTEISMFLLSDTSTLREAMIKINAGKYGAVLITDENNVLVGMLTDGDVRREILDGASLDHCVTEYMRTDFVAGSINSSHEENISLLNSKIRHLPLLDDAGHPVDVISWAKMWQIPVTVPYLGGNELKYVSDCIASSWISSQGPYVTRFEKMFAEYCGTDAAITTSNGTTALHLALKALDVGPGDEVIIPDMTFAACANVVIHCGATPVFVDVAEDSWTMAPELIERAISKNTRVIMAVHLYGHPCDMDPIMDIAEKHELRVIEDCAEALGAKYKGRMAGTIGHIGCFSFFANKVITTGEGGMITTDDQGLLKKMEILRDHGMSKDRRYWHEMVGFNYRMTNIQAAIGVAQLENIDKFLETRKLTAEMYRSELVDIDGITLPPAAEWAENIYWLYSILVDEDVLGISASELMRLLNKEGVDSRPFFSPLHVQPPYKSDGYYPVTERLAEQGLSLPTGNEIGIEEVSRVGKAIRTILENNNILCS